MVYQGSKSKILKYIKPYIDKALDYFDRELYIEPFVGGANVICNIEACTRVGYDINEYLIALLNYAKNNELPYPKEITNEEYAHIRNNKDKYSEWFIGYIGFLGSYQSRFFEGNCSNKRRTLDCKKTYMEEQYNNLLKQSPKLKEIEFYCADALDLSFSNAVIYCDPPYLNTAKYRNKIDYKKYYDWVRRQGQENIILCSETYMPEDFKIISSVQRKNDLGTAANKRIITENLYTIGLGESLTF